MSHPFCPLTVRTIALVCGLASSALLVSCDRGPKRALRMNLVPGSTYVLTTRDLGELTAVDPDGKETKISLTGENTFVLRPKETDEHGNVLVSVEAGKTAFPMFHAQLNAAFEGYSFGIKLSPVGRVTELVDTETIRQSISANLPGVDSVLKALSDDALRSLIEPVTAIWPSLPVSVGDEWTRSDIYLPFSDSLESTKFRLESWDDSGAVIKFESSYRPAGKGKEPSLLEVAGKSKGEIHISPVEGTIRSFEADKEVAGTLTNKASGAITKVSGQSRIQAELTAR